MKLDVIKNAVTSKAARQVLIGKKHSPTILFGAGVVGVVASTVLACKATLKLEEVLDEAEHTRKAVNELQHHDYSQQDRAQDHAKITARTARNVAKLYAPSVAVGIVSVAALTGSHVVLSRRNAAVMAAYSALDKGFNQYRARVKEEFGEEKDREFRHGVETRSEVVETKDGSKTIEHKSVAKGMPSIYARFFDEGSTLWQRQPDYNQFFLRCQQNYANDLLKARGHVFLNEVYDMLGLPRSKAGAVVGWVISKDGDNFVDFGVFEGNSERARAFVNGQEHSILLDFNVDGVIYDKI